MDKIKVLSNGIKIPSVGLGVFRAENGDEAKNSVIYGIKAGYRHIDTAQAYGNEESVGDALKVCGVKREEIFVTTKVSTKNIHAKNTKACVLESLEKLGLEYADLILIHWPVGDYKACWSDLEDLYNEGKIKAIGVSNFQIHHLKDLEITQKIAPMVNQIEINPQFPNSEVVKYCADNNIVVQGWSPLGGGRVNTLIPNEKLIEIGKKYNKSTAQVMVRWSLQNGIVVLPKSVKEERIISNFDVYDFELTAEDMAVIATLDTGIRTGSDPDNNNF